MKPHNTEPIHKWMEKNNIGYPLPNEILFGRAVGDTKEMDAELIERQQYELKFRKEQERIKERNKVIVASSIVAFIVLFIVGLWTSELIRTIGKWMLALGVISIVLAAIYNFVKEAVDAFMD